MHRQRIYLHPEHRFFISFDLRVSSKVVLIVEFNGTNDAKTIGLCPDFQLADLFICILWVILCNIGFKASGIKDRHGCFFSVYLLQDRLRQIHQGIEKQLQVVCKLLFEASNLRGIRNFGKSAEITKIFRVFKNSQEQGVGRDREDPLDNESPE